MANNLAGLAALGALGYIIKSRQDGKNIPVEDRRQPASMPEAPVDDSGNFYEAGSGPTGAALASNPGPMDDESQWGGTGGATYREPTKRLPARPTSPSSQGSRYPTPPQRLTTSNDPRVNPNFNPATAPGAGPRGYDPTQGTAPREAPLENMTPYLLPGGVVKRVAMLAKMAAQTPKEVSSAGREEVTNPMMWMAGPKNAKNFKTEKEISSAGREEVTNPLAWMAGPKGALGKTAKEKKALSEADTTGGATGYKKGGPLKAKGKPKSMKLASGGSTRSSASKRGDGIASKGRTRGKMY